MTVLAGFAPAQGLELDQALSQHRGVRRHQFGEGRLACLASGTGGSAQAFLQRQYGPDVADARPNTHGVSGQFDRPLPHRLRQLPPPRLGAANLIQLAL